MASFNKVILLGNLTRDPEVRYTPKGSAVCDLGIAVNRVYTTDSGEKREEVTYVDVVLWARLAEIAGEYLKKGRPVFIEGRLKFGPLLSALFVVPRVHLQTAFDEDRLQ